MGDHTDQGHGRGWAAGQGSPRLAWAFSRMTGKLEQLGRRRQGGICPDRRGMGVALISSWTGLMAAPGLLGRL